MSNHSHRSHRSQRNNNHEFWTRLRHDHDTVETPTARCAFSWHIAAALGFVGIGVAVLYTQSVTLEDTIADQVAWGRQVAQVLTVSCTALLALFVATPMIYFVVNTTTVVTK